MKKFLKRLLTPVPIFEDPPSVFSIIYLIFEIILAVDLSIIWVKLEIPSAEGVRFITMLSVYILSFQYIKNKWRFRDE